jgi:plastocyanin
MRVLMILCCLLMSGASAIPLSRPALHIIDMKVMSFSPALLEIQAGDTVQWVNTSAGDHNVVFKNIGVKSDMLQRGQTFRYVFKTAGTYPYYCQPHRLMGMKGTIRVIQKK